MQHNSFIDSFFSALDAISSALNLPHLKLDENLRCKLRYDNAFDLEIIGNPDGWIQMHAYVWRYVESENPAYLLKRLLKLNAANSHLMGGYCSLDETAGSIAFSLNVPFSQIRELELANLLSNFIEAADRAKHEIERFVQAEEIQTTAQPLNNSSGVRSWMQLQR